MPLYNPPSGGSAISDLTTGQHVVATSPTTIGTDGVKRYVALLSQSGTDAPEVIAVNENLLGGSLVWTYVSVGKYRGTLAGAFPSAAKIQIFTGGVVGFVSLVRVSSDAIDLYVADATGGLNDEVLSSASIEIRVYPNP